jgi:hypothetical protein
VVLIPARTWTSGLVFVDLPPGDRFVQTMQAHLHTRNQPLIVQSFEAANLSVLAPALE